MPRINRILIKNALYAAISVFILMGCGYENEQGLNPKIVGGEKATSDMRVPGVGVLFRTGTVSGGSAYATKVCTAARVGDLTFLTSGNCLYEYYKYDGALVLMRSTKKVYHGVNITQIKIHPEYLKRIDPSYNVGLFKIDKLPSGFDVPIATFDFNQKPGINDTIATIGAGCEKADSEGKCLGGPTITSYLKYLISNVVAAPATRDDFSDYFFGDQEDGHIADGDIGGPVFNNRISTDLKIVGVNSYAMDNSRTIPAYLWVGSPKIKNFLLDIKFNKEQGYSSPFEKEVLTVLKNSYWGLEKCGYDTQKHAIFRGVKEAIQRPEGGVEPPSDVAFSLRCSADQYGKMAQQRTLLASAALAEEALELYRQSLNESNPTKKRELQEDAQEMLNLAKDIFKVVLEIGIGLSPLGRAKDFTECIIGVSLIPDFEKLSTVDRAFACIGALSIDQKILKILTKYMVKSGLWAKIVYQFDRFADYLKPLVDRLARIKVKLPGLADKQINGLIDDLREVGGKKLTTGQAEEIIDAANNLGITKKGMKAYARIHNALDTLPNGLKVKRIHEGAAPDKIAIIGRSMGNRKIKPIQVGVNDAASHLESKGIKVNTFSDDEAWDEFVKHQQRYNARHGLPLDTHLPNNEVVKTLMYKRNKQWAQKLVNEGYTIVDLGDPNGLNVFSPFYAIEKLVIFGN